MHTISAFVVAALAAFTALRAQNTVQLTPVKDNTLYDDPNGALSNARGNHTFVGLTLASLARRTVSKFDIGAAVPAGSRILSVTLTLQVTRTNSTNTSPFFVHRALQDWGEGTSQATLNEGMGTAATAGDATWIHTFHPLGQWVAPGGDYVATASATALSPASGTFVIPSSPGLVADVQSMLDNPASNYGWVWLGDETISSSATRIASRENPTVNNRPRLSVTYVAPGNTASLGAGCLGSNNQVLDLSIVGAMTGGNTVQLTISNGLSGAIAANYLAFAPIAAPQQISPGCNIYIDPNSLVLINFVNLSAAGTHATPVVVPNGLTGFVACLQSGAVDSARPGGLVSTDGILLVLP